jgi:hypothetical protein
VTTRSILIIIGTTRGRRSRGHNRGS